MKTHASLRELVCFRLEGGMYAVDIELVREIVRLQRLTRVPKAPGHVLGVTNLRGHVIPVVDLRRRLGMHAQEPGAASRILVTELAAESIGFVVDEVSGIIRLPEEMIDPAGSLGALKGSEMIQGVARHDGELICVLDLGCSRDDVDVAEPVSLPAAQPGAGRLTGPRPLNRAA